MFHKMIDAVRTSLLPSFLSHLLADYEHAQTFSSGFRVDWVNQMLGKPKARIVQYTSLLFLQVK